MKFLMVGNDIPGRRIDVLVEGFRRYGKGELLLIGRGASKWGGMEGVAWDELPRYYDEADVYVHNGEEQYSTAVQMAAQRGLPIICSKDVGIVADVEPTIAVADWKTPDGWLKAFEEFERMKEVAPTRFERRIEMTAAEIIRRMRNGVGAER